MQHSKYKMKDFSSQEGTSVYAFSLVKWNTKFWVSHHLVQDVCFMIGGTGQELSWGGLMS